MENLVEVRDLHVRFRTDEGIVYAVNGVNYDIEAGKTMGIVGESGCGKSVSANAMMQLLPDNGWVESGSIMYNAPEGVFDVTKLDKKDRRTALVHGKEMAMIFQEPMTSFCPVYTIGNQITEAVRLHTDLPKTGWRDYVIGLLRKVGIAKPEERIDEYPYQLSGGMRQRAMIAMAVAAHPRLLIADEPTTSLDVTVQAQILNLLKDLQQEYGMSMLMINHNFGIIAETCDIVAVMYLGYIIEYASTGEVLKNPLHPYTRDLLRSVPQVTDPKGVKLSYIKGTVPGAYTVPQGCAYAERCGKKIAGLCDVKKPEPVTAGDHMVSCHLYAQGGNE
ncbi:MAG: ABC transporter ATP-binding protein [Treponema sp.]|jgi:peptide/nickel transport system ATP-binding protein|nr:ABC transporter ATP-binding protein [Treponema sp.]